ncbi:MAG: hypothetical protein ACUVS7_17935, partial [Bryobacteraceae bacterium]
MSPSVLGEGFARQEDQVLRRAGRGFGFLGGRRFRRPFQGGELGLGQPSGGTAAARAAGTALAPVAHFRGRRGFL